MKKTAILVLLIFLIVACNPSSKEETKPPPPTPPPATTKATRADQSPKATPTQSEVIPETDETEESTPDESKILSEPAIDKWSLWVNGPHLRGVDLHPCVLFTEDGCVQPITRQDIQDLRDLGANLINASYPGLFTEDAPYEVNPTALAYLDDLIQWAEEVGVYVVIHFRTGPGRNEGAITFEGEPRFDVWTDQAAHDAWVEMWRFTADRYRDSPVVVGYDLMVEPHPNTLIDPDGELEPMEVQAQLEGTLMDWNAFAAEITTAIRQVDPDTPIIVSSLSWASAEWFAVLEPTGDSRTIYSLHAYDPDIYVVQEEGETAIGYPDVVNDDGEMITFDRAWLDQNYRPVREFAQQHNVPIYVGEFGAVRWVPGAADFLSDQTDLFEQYGWNYAIYVWRGDEPYFDGFNMEYGPDPENHTPILDNPLLGVLRDRWAQNVDFPGNLTIPASPTPPEAPPEPVETEEPIPDESETSPAPATIDKWTLWVDGPHLRGANIWQAVVIPDLDGLEFKGDGQVGPPYTQKDFNRLAAMGANYVSISGPGLFTETPPYTVDPGVQAHLDNLLAMIAKADMFATIGFRTGPGRSEFGLCCGGEPEFEGYFNDSVWEDQAAQNAWVEMWHYTANRYGDNPIVAGYKLMVEPNSSGVFFDIYDPDEFYADYAGTLYDWNQFYPRLVAGIRQVDVDTPILVGGNGWSGVAWLPYLQPTGDPRTVYIVHQYEPQDDYTHQEPSGENTYPGVWDTNYDGEDDQFNRAWLDNLLSTVDTFAATHNVPVAVDEYGVNRWVPGGVEFMDDQMDSFEQRSMNQALWEWQTSWKPFADDVNDMTYRFGPDPNSRAEVPNDLMNVITRYWARNTIRPSTLTAATESPSTTSAPTGGEWWQPAVDTTWQWHLSNLPIDHSFEVDMYDIEMFDNDAGVVDALHAQGRKVICYISVGSWEDWRPDKDQFPASVIGNDYGGWPGEKWLDIRQIDLLAPIMQARLDECQAKGFDGIEPDNIDSYTNDTGFPLTYEDQLNYNIWLANEAHARGLSIGLKNDPEQVDDLLPYFDWALTEDCFAEDWCEEMLPFIKAGKPVFAAEYTDTGITTGQFCPQADTMNISAILKNRDLDAYQEACR